MNIQDSLGQWKERSALTEEQHALLLGLSRGEPASVYLELNILLYAGVLALIGGLGWTVTTWSQQLGSLLILTLLSVLFCGSLWYSFTRAVAWSAEKVSSPNLIFDYVLYCGCLTWSVELGYIEKHFHLLGGQWDSYLLATAVLFGFFAYWFDNRFVLTLALSSLAGWFGLTISHWPAHQDAAYRQCALVYSATLMAAGLLLERRGWKAHFLWTYLNIAANVLFWALLSGVFPAQGYWPWIFGLVLACGTSLTWGLNRREFSFVAYAAVYGYIGVSSLLVRNVHDATPGFAYFVITGIGMLWLLVSIARRFGREA